MCFLCAQKEKNQIKFGKPIALSLLHHLREFISSSSKKTLKILCKGPGQVHAMGHWVTTRGMELCHKSSMFCNGKLEISEEIVSEC